MDTLEYICSAVRTESKDFDSIADRMTTKEAIRLNHAAMGMVTEAAEFLDVLKKHIYYGKTIDKVNLAEEIGDLCWYMAIACDELHVNLEDIMETNIAKLKARYPNKFTSEDAINRNLETERKILEK
jgi:NTP pyrophosphatase (non-canonical NTP hydrolase)